MTQTASVFTYSSQFDEFLQASIGEDDHGMLLSVLSMLARLELDPWQEAARLAQLPADLAAQKLASLLAALPQASVAYLDPVTVAARLTKLLPRRTNANVTLGNIPLGVRSMTRPSAVVVVLIIMAITLLAQYAFRSSH